MKQVILILFLCCSLSAEKINFLGKYKEKNVDGVKTLTAKSLALKAAFTKGVDLLLSFDYLDNSADLISISYTTNDDLYSSLKGGEKNRVVDMIKLQKNSVWQSHKVLLSNIDFDKSYKSHVKLSVRGKEVAYRNFKLEKISREKVSAKKSDKLNVLMIISDDLNDYVASFGGHPQTITPNIDKLATSGVKFNRAYCQYPVCGPSRASFLHGLYPESTKVIDNKIYARDVIPKVPNMFQHFRQNGYFTAAAGKIFHSKFGLYEKGISLDDYHHIPHAENPQTLLLKEEYESLGAKGPFSEFQKKNRVNDQAEKVLYYGTGMKDDQHSDGRNARKVAQWLKENRNGNKPFFMACGLVKPHVPFYAPSKYFKQYDKSSLEFKDVPVDDWANRPKIAQVKSYSRFGHAEMGVNNRENRAAYLQAYLACISFMDAQVKVLLDALDASGQRDNTVVIFMSDHGFHIGEHFMYGKVTLFEECARVPLIIHHPQMKGNSKQAESLVELIDIYPTLVDLCKLPKPAFDFQGKSLVPLLNDPRKKVKDQVYTVVTRGQKVGRALRTQRWRYTNWGSSKDIELYDLQKDPEEYNNLARLKEFQPIVDELEKKLKAKVALNK